MAASNDRRPVRWLLVALLAAFALTLASCGSSSDDAGDDGGSATTEAADEGGGGDDEATTTAAEDTTTTEDGGEAGGGGDLVGTWTADANDILGANTANLGGVTFECTGPITLEFGDDGAFSQTGTSTCTVQGQSGTAEFNATGTYEASDGTITVTDVTNEGTMTMMGVAQPMEGGFGGGEAEYTLEGDTLSITFTEETVGTVTQVYTRS